MSSRNRPRIYVLAGVNGAGKSTIAGAAFQYFGAAYHNPDEAAARLVRINPNLSPAEANSIVWHQGVRLLQRAINERLDFAFETTLGANTIPRLLREAARRAIDIRMWYVGLSTPQLHIDRVQARVRQGGHDIPTDLIYRRLERSRLNLIELLPLLSALRLYDNTAEADPMAGEMPRPTLLLHVENRKIVGPNDLSRTPDWAKPIVAAALKL